MARVRQLVKNLAGLPAFTPADQYPLVEAWVRAGLPIAEAKRAAAWGVMPVGGGAVEDGAVVLQNVPVAPFVIDPPRFFAMTEQNFDLATSFAENAGNPWTPVQLPAVGIYGKIVLQFVGTLTVGVAAATTTARWPYGFLEAVGFTANGQDDLFSCQGLALKALEVARYPYNNSTADDLLGPGIGGGSNLAVGNHDLRLTYEIPLAFDESSLIGSLFAQSRALNLLLRGRDAALAEIATAGAGGTLAMAGTWNVAVQYFQVPIEQGGKLVLPDLRFLHGFNEITTPFAASPAESRLIRVAGTLQRLLVQTVQRSQAAAVFYDPANDDEIDQYELRFGTNKRPYRWNPAQMLVSRNVRDYGRVLPYRYAAVDLSRYNAIRDSINLGGVTEAFLTTTLDGAAAAPHASAHQRICEETLFQ